MKRNRQQSSCALVPGWCRLIAILALVGCGTSGAVSESAEPALFVPKSQDRPQYPSTYQRRDYPPVAITNATVMTAARDELRSAAIVFRDGRIVSVGGGIPIPDDAEVIDGTGKFVTPGLIDTHSHVGVYAAPGTAAESDGNEAVDPNTAHVWAEHSVWPQDPQIPLAVAGGVTTAQILPGSANLIGGRSVTVKLIPARSVQEMKFPGAPHGLKIACGENPKRVYGSKGGPATRMGNVAGYREAFAEAEKYRHDREKWLRDESSTLPQRDFAKETLAEVLKGNIAVHNHCYRADEMVQMLDLAREFDFEIRSFHHAVEAYKIADRLAEAGVASSIWADWWGFKEESMDGIPENAALLTASGARAIIHSDSGIGIQRLNQEASKAYHAGLSAGIELTRDQVIRWITANPAWALNIDEVTGTLEAGKMADVVVWNGDPFSVYSVAERVYSDGWLVYDIEDRNPAWRTDFEIAREDEDEK